LFRVKRPPDFTDFDLVLLVVEIVPAGACFNIPAFCFAISSYSC